MASLIKNQILKHLSKFTKNLSPDKLQLSAIKGSCEVSNIELNEIVLMQLLELPVWMSLTRAYCNFASIKIQWMKLKTIPIFISLDEVIIEVSACENFRNGSGGPMNQSINLQQDMGSYGFTQKVIDGITLSINSVLIRFSSKMFSASVELTYINIESRNCLWKKVDDLSKTRIRDPAAGQVLIFKHIEWHRFVAQSEAKTALGQAPLRLIANQASCRITLKKRLSDCAVLAARIMLIFDDLLWVLTDSQLLSALHFGDYLGDLIKRAPRTKKFDNPNDSKNDSQSKTKTIHQNHIAGKNFSNPLSHQFDIKETSHHIIIGRLEVHLMDDLAPSSERSQCPELKDGGALQISFQKLLIDFYPYHRANGGSGDRNHWFRYHDPSPDRDSFISDKLDSYFKRQKVQLNSEGSKFDIDSLKSHLISQVFLVRINDYSVGCVSTNSPAKDKNNSESFKLIHFDNSSPVPGNVPPIYIELNNYFFCEPFDKLNFQTPERNIYAIVAPLKIIFEPLTILWINAFFANLQSALMKLMNELQEAFPQPENSQDKVNIRAEILMPTVLVKLPEKVNYKLEYDAIEIKISKIVLYNCDPFMRRENFHNLDNLMKMFSTNIDFFYEQSNYPWMSCDMKPISLDFTQKINQLFLSNSSATVPDIDFLAIQLEPLWIEIKSLERNVSEPLVEPVNVTIWINQTDKEKANTEMDFNIFLRIADPIKVQLTHDQFIFLLRMIETMGEFTSALNYDIYMIQRAQYKKANECPDVPCYSFDLEEKIIKAIFKNNSIVGHIPQVDVFLVLKQEFTEEISLSDDDDSHHSTIENQSLERKLSDDTGIDSIRNHETEDIQQPFENGQNHVFTTEPDCFMESVSIPKSNSDIYLLENSNKQHFATCHKKKNSLSGFDPLNIKIHYAADNEDALSTISDFSVDDSDHQSLIATINNDESPDVLEQILASPEAVEEALDVLEVLDIKEDLPCDSTVKTSETIKSCHMDVLHAKITNLDLILESSKGFLSQVFVNLKLAHLEEFRKVPKAKFLDQFKNFKQNEPMAEEISKNKIALRVDSFSKGTLKDELISIHVNGVNQALNKETIDLLIDFVNDNITEKVAPMNILVEDVNFKIIDNSLRIPPMVVNVPRLGICRTKENRMLIEMNDSFPKNVPPTHYLLLQHLKIFERNLIFDVVDLIREQDRLTVHPAISEKEQANQADTQEILNQVLTQKELLLAEIELLRKENEDLRKRLPTSK